MKDLETKIITPEMNLQEIIDIKLDRERAYEITKTNLKMTKEVKDRWTKNMTIDYNRNAIDFGFRGYYRH